MKYLIKFLTAICLIASGTTIQAQNTIPATGGNAAGSGGSVSYSAGQVVYTTNIDITSGSVAQGVQQPYEISVITGLKETKGINLTASVYPNPSSDFLTLRIENCNRENLSYQLFDSNGRLLENKKVTGDETTIPVGNLLSGPYFLKIIDNQIEIKTFKIIKTK